MRVILTRANVLKKQKASKKLGSIGTLVRNGHDINTEATFCRCSSKYVFLKLSQYSQETPVLESLFNKVAGLLTYNLLKKLQHRRFPVNIAKFLRTAVFKEHLRWLLLLT